MEVLRRVKLEDEIELLYGKGLTKKQRVNGDIPVYGSNGIVDYHIESCFRGPSIILGRKGTVGSVEYSKGDFWAIDTTYIVKTKSQEDDIKFWYYFLKTLNLHQMNTHSAVPGLNRDNVYALTVDVLDSYSERKRVANILSLFDEKIETNNQINKKLEKISQAIFKKWFIDFDFQNEEGQPYKSSGGEMIESEMGLIPKGWEIGTINDIGTIVGGGTPSKKREDYFTENGIPWITPKDLSGNKNKFINRGALDITEDALKNSSAKLMPKGTVLFSSRAPIGYIAIAKNSVTTNQGFKSIIPNEDIGTEFVYRILTSKKEVIESRASGSTFKEISGGELKKIPIIIPDRNLIQQFNDLAESLSSLILKNEDEINYLAITRDILLPKLMSGEISVPVE